MFEKGNDYLVFIKRNADISWRTVACVESNDLNVSSDTIDVSSGGYGNWADHFNSRKSFNFNANGVAVSDGLDPSGASYDILFSLSTTGEPFHIKVAKVGGGYVREGIVTIVNYTEGQSANAPFTFSASFKGKGRICGD